MTLRRILAFLPLALLAACSGGEERSAMPAAARQCALCHSFEKGGPATAGPNLFAIMGEKAGGRSGYPFSSALKSSGLVWTPETIDGFIAAPQKLVPGTRMGFAGESDPVKRRAIVEYMQSQSAEKTK